MDTIELQKLVVKPTDSCIVRQQEEEYLLYNSKTDELHLLSPMAFYVYQLCDGATTAGEIQAILSIILNQNKAIDITNITDFLNKLIIRGILEV